MVGACHEQSCPPFAGSREKVFRVRHRNDAIRCSMDEEERAWCDPGDLINRPFDGRQAFPKLGYGDDQFAPKINRQETTNGSKLPPQAVCDILLHTGQRRVGGNRINRWIPTCGENGRGCAEGAADSRDRLVPFAFQKGSGALDVNRLPFTEASPAAVAIRRAILTQVDAQDSHAGPVKRG
jgi:hypothetical protein